MTYSIHALELHKTITAPSTDGTIDILPFRSLVAPGNLEPDPADHLAEPTQVDDAASILPGMYLFTQVPYPAAQEERLPAFRAAAEAVWLEALWRSARLKNDRILVRILTEDEKTVFQIFREIETPV